KWSDGVPLTAADSVYSFQLASDPATPVVKRTSDQVASYQALDALTVQMVSKPGLVTDMFEKYFWTPLPQHVWGEYTAEELLTAEVSTRTPLGWGAYVIEEWIPGEAIRLKKNLEYFRADEGLPKFDFLEFKVIGKDQNILDMVQTGNCDIVDNSGIPYKDYGKLVEENQNGEIKLFAMESKEWEILAFGIKPASYDDGYYPYGSDRPDIFGDLRVRQAFAQCINRERILKDFLYDLPELPRAYLRSSHPLYGLVQPLSCYDPQQGIRFLEDAGWLDQDLNPATPRIAYGVANVPDGTKLIVNYFLSDALLRKMVAEDIANSLGQCGVQVNLETIPINDLYVSGPDGIIFGRGFDLAQLSWVIGNQPPCELFESEEIPSKDNFWLGRDNGGGNITGYSNPVYDESCRLAHRAGMNLDLYLSSQTAEANLLVDQVPVIPLYFHPQLLVARMDLCDINLDDSAISTFNSLEEWDLGNACSAFGWCWLTKLHCQSVLSDIK
ncbi:MAG TPA: hypothetical protein G4N92_02200, partial [Anaerolineae bacterium]|nr:hypothetical protein [Anaerolineae bacterium]